MTANIPSNITPVELIKYYHEHPHFLHRLMEVVEDQEIDNEILTDKVTLLEEQVETLCDLYYEANEIIEVVQTLSFDETQKAEEARESLHSIKTLTNCPLEDFNGDFDHWYSVKYPTK